MSKLTSGAGRFSDVPFAYLLIAPAILGIFLIILFPLLYSFWMSFADVNLLSRKGPALEFLGIRLPLFKFVGLKNYFDVFTDSLYWSSFARTAYFVAAFVLEATAVGLAIALILHEKFYGRTLMRSLLLIPWSLSRVVVGLLWIGILDAEFGALNGLFFNIGIIDRYIAFFEHGFGAMNILVFVYMWNQAPFTTLLFLASLQSIPVQQYMAAEVDGATPWQKFRHVTLPALKPTLFLVLVLCTVNGFLMLDLIFVMTMGGPAHDTTTISWLGFQTTFNFFKFGTGTAILYTLTVLCLSLTWVYHKLIFRKPEAGG
jgi:ABC-type sugar transport system permease subunit